VIFDLASKTSAAVFFLPLPGLGFDFSEITLDLGSFPSFVAVLGWFYLAFDLDLSF
jgi:hypothetical protein